MLPLWHRLRHNKLCALPKTIVFVDVESKTSVNDEGAEIDTLRVGWACFWRRYKTRANDTFVWHEFYNCNDFWAWLFSLHKQSKKIYVVSHNIKYDMSVLNAWHYLPDDGWTCSKPFFNNNVMIMGFRKDKKKIVLINNGNYFMTSLKEIGKTVGLEKLDVDFRTVSDSDLSLYCKRDVEILIKLWQIFLNFISSEDVGGFKPTIGSLAIHAFRHKFMDHEIFIHKHERAILLERLAYHGGRTECFRLGKFEGEDYYKLDVNSMYPYVMKNEVYPTKMIFHGYSCSVDKLAELLQDRLIIAQVTISTCDNYYPIKTDSKLIFGIGTFITTLCTPELKLAIDSNVIIRVHEYCVYESAPIFENYVKFFWRKRCEAIESNNQIFNYFFKLMLNSLYGKFGQRACEMKVVGKCEPNEFRVENCINADSHERFELIYFCGLIYRREFIGESYDSFVAIAAHVTSYARIKLLELMLKTRFDNIMYCDTDSLFINRTGLDNLKSVIEPKTLGMLKIEDQTNCFVIHNCKDYSFGDSIKIKGIKKDAEMIDESTFRQDHWLSMKGLLNSEQAFGYKRISTIKHLNRWYTKGFTTLDGYVLALPVTVIDSENFIDYADYGLLYNIIDNYDQVYNEYGERALLS